MALEIDNERLREEVGKLEKTLKKERIENRMVKVKLAKMKGLENYVPPIDIIFTYCHPPTMTLEIENELLQTQVAQLKKTLMEERWEIMKYETELTEMESFVPHSIGATYGVGGED